MIIITIPPLNEYRRQYQPHDRELISQQNRVVFIDNSEDSDN